MQVVLGAQIFSVQLGQYICEPLNPKKGRMRRGLLLPVREIDDCGHHCPLNVQNMRLVLRKSFNPLLRSLPVFGNLPLWTRLKVRAETDVQHLLCRPMSSRRAAPKVRADLH